MLVCVAFDQFADFEAEKNDDHDTDHYANDRAPKNCISVHSNPLVIYRVSLFDSHVYGGTMCSSDFGFTY